MSNLLSAFNEIGVAFIADPSIWWLLTPIFVLWILMEIYFGEYKREKLGFSSALANGVTLSWVNIASFRVFFVSPPDDALLRGLILLGLFFYGLFVIYMSFRHIVPEKIAEILAGPNLVYFLSVISVLWGQGVLATDRWVVAAIFILFIIVIFFFWLIKRYFLGFSGEAEAIKKGEEPL